MRVLVVDDEPDVRLVLAQALRERGHQVEVASTGHEAIDLAATFQPEAALVDVGLPDIDGVTLAELSAASSPTAASASSPSAATANPASAPPSAATSSTAIC